MNDEELQQLLDDTAARLGVVGAQLAIYDGLHRRVFATGFRNREQGLPVTPDTLFQIGSTTKVFNAALILSLVDEGKLDLDISVQEYTRDFRLADVKAQKCISLRRLLSMSAGLDNGPYYDYGRGDDALGRYVEVLGGIPSLFAPGSAYGYSNASSNVAGYVAAHVVGRTWEEILRERIWEPLKLAESSLFAEDLLLRPVALGYKRVAIGSAPQRASVWCLPRSLGPAGALTCCSAGDLVAFARMFLDHGKSMDGVQVISEAAAEAMQQPQVKLPTRFFADEWCLGPFRQRWGNHVLYGHNGTNFSGSSTLLWCPEKNMAISTVVNVPDQGYPFADTIFSAVLPKMFGIYKPPPPTRDSVTAVETDLQPYVGRFEAFGMIQTLAIEGRKLRLTSSMAIAPEMDVAGCELIPLGDGRFLPCDLRVSGNRNWDMAFWGSDVYGRATHLLQGIFPLRRTN